MKDQTSCYNSEFHVTHDHQVTNSIIQTPQYPWHLFTRKANKTSTGSEGINATTIYSCGNHIKHSDVQPLVKL